MFFCFLTCLGTCRLERNHFGESLREIRSAEPRFASKLLGAKSDPPRLVAARDALSAAQLDTPEGSHLRDAGERRRVWWFWEFFFFFCFCFLCFGVFFCFCVFFFYVCVRVYVFFFGCVCVFFVFF